MSLLFEEEGLSGEKYQTNHVQNNKILVLASTANEFV